MKIQCPRCGAGMKIADSLERDRSPVVRCAKCNGLFFMDIQDGEPVPVEMDGAETEAPLENVYVSRHKQAKRYLVLVVALFLAVLGYQFFEAVRKSEALDQIRRTAAKSALKQLARAQEQYYLETDAYTDNLDHLAAYYRVRPSIIINITRADASSWAATACHEKSSTGLIYDSAKGGLQWEDYIRADSP